MMVKHLIKLRDWWRSLSIVLIVAAIFFKLPITFCALQLGFVFLICPMGFLEFSLAAKSFAIQLLPGMLIVIASIIIFGRAFCSWLCPSRFFGNMTQTIGHKKIPLIESSIRTRYINLRNHINGKLNLNWRDGMALFAGLMIGIWIFEFPAYTIFCPIGVLSRNLIELGTHFRLRWDLFFLAIPLVVGLFFNLGWKCACPVGLLQGVLATSNRTFQPVIQQDRCAGCGKCVENCGAGVNLHKNEFSSFSCSKCLNCIRDCNKKAVDLKLIRIFKN
jgi:ferredoxin-type protein NapH